MPPRRALALLVGVAVLGCSTQYTPRTPGRVSIVIADGSVAYHRDGRVVPHGMFGSGLTEVVGDDPEARALAETAESSATTGFAATLAGALCLVGGVAYGLSDLENEDSVAIGLGGGLLCYVAGALVGTAMLLDAQRATFDAINVFNDRQELRRRPAWTPYPGGPWGYPYPYAPPPASGAPPPATPGSAPSPPPPPPPATPPAGPGAGRP